MGAVETFRGISLLIFRWALYVALFLMVAGALIGGSIWLYTWDTHDRHVENVELEVDPKHEHCKEDRFPLFVSIINRSEKTVKSVSFTMAARVKGRSSNIASYRSSEDDHVLEPKSGWGQCWSVPELREKVKDPRELEWSIDYKTIRFMD